MMNHCPSHESIAAALSDAAYEQEEREHVLKHVAACAKCREHARAITNLEGLLEQTQQTAQGSIDVAQAAIRPEFARRLKQTVLEAFDRQEAEKLRVRELIQDLLRKLWPSSSGVAPEPAALGYRRRPQPTDQNTAVQIETHLLSILDAILDPAISDAERLARVERLAKAASEAQTDH